MSTSGHWTREETDAVCLAHLGQTWAQVAAEHDMKCGRCNPGMLILATVTIDQFFPPWKWPKWDRSEPARWTPLPTWEPVTTVTLVLRCDTCGLEFEMPLHAKEGQAR